jgi:hypothetical protein
MKQTILILLTILVLLAIGAAPAKADQVVIQQQVIIVYPYPLLYVPSRHIWPYTYRATPKPYVPKWEYRAAGLPYTMKGKTIIEGMSIEAVIDALGKPNGKNSWIQNIMVKNLKDPKNKYVNTNFELTYKVPKTDEEVSFWVNSISGVSGITAKGKRQ